MLKRLVSPLSLKEFFELQKLHKKFKKEYLNVLKRESQVSEPGTSDTTRLENIMLIKDLLFSKLLTWYLLLYALPLIFILFFVFSSPVSNTAITADLYVSTINFVNTDTIQYNPPDSFLVNKCAGTCEFVNCRAEEFSEEIANYSVKPVANELTSITELYIPKLNNIIIEKPTSSLLRLTVVKGDQRNSFENTLAKVSSSNAIIENENNVITHLRKDEAHASSNQVTFKKTMKDNRNFMMSMDGVRHFELNRFSATNFQFTENSEKKDVLPSSVLSGVIHFNDTRDDSLLLNEGDLLQITFTNPIKVKLQAEENGIHLHLQGEVNKIKAGAQIQLSNKKLNRMPLLFKVWYDQEPWLWGIIAGLIPVLLTFFIRPRRQL